MNIFARILRLVLTAVFSFGLGEFGRKSVLERPALLTGKSRIFVGQRTLIRKGVRIEAVEVEGSRLKTPEVRIGSDCVIELNVHIAAVDSVRIMDNVVIAGNTYISDHDHNYEDVLLPIMAQGVNVKGPVLIDDCAWIGQGVCVLSGVRIGKHSIIGANSVVTHDVPDFSVAVGSPARVVKRYDEKKRVWVKV